MGRAPKIKSRRSNPPLKNTSMSAALFLQKLIKTEQKVKI